MLHPKIRITEKFYNETRLPDFVSITNTYKPNACEGEVKLSGLKLKTNDYKPNADQVKAKTIVSNYKTNIYKPNAYEDEAKANNFVKKNPISKRMLRNMRLTKDDLAPNLVFFNIKNNRVVIHPMVLYKNTKDFNTKIMHFHYFPHVLRLNRHAFLKKVYGFVKNPSPFDKNLIGLLKNYTAYIINTNVFVTDSFVFVSMLRSKN